MNAVAAIETVDGLVAHAVNAYLLDPGVGALLTDAVAFGVRFAFPRVYQQAVRDQACIGDVVPTLRRLADQLEGCAQP